MAEKDRIRNICVRLKLSDTEHKILKQKSEYCNVDMSSFLRNLITDGYIIKYDLDGLQELSTEINKIGVNINQIAKHINEKGGYYDKSDMNILKKQIDNLTSLIMKKILNIG